MQIRYRKYQAATKYYEVIEVFNGLKERLFVNYGGNGKFGRFSEKPVSELNKTLRDRLNNGYKLERDTMMKTVSGTREMAQILNFNAESLTLADKVIAAIENDFEPPKSEPESTVEVYKTASSEIPTWGSW